MKSDGYYTYGKTGVYHDPRMYAASTGNPCPMLQEGDWSEYEWRRRPPVGFRLCGRCAGLAGRR